MEESGELIRSRDLLLRFGWNTTCYQILNRGFRRWFSEGGEAVAGYVLKSGFRVVAGAPVCARDRLPAMIREFEADAVRSGHRVCYFAAEGRMRELTEQDREYSRVVLGSQPVWSPETFLRKFDGSRSLRAQRNRAVNKGVYVEEWDAGRAQQNSELKEVLQEWLSTRGLPPMHFLIEAETLDRLVDRRVFVASAGGRIQAFLTLAPIPARNGWLTEQFPRRPAAPNGTVDLLMATAAANLPGGSFLTMGIVPLSQMATDPEAQNPAWLRAVASWARLHGRRFYNFAGLEWFKSKFQPDFWEPNYLISREQKFSARSLYATIGAFTGNPPLISLSRGMADALRRDLNLAARLHGK